MSNTDLVLRRARPNDRAAMERICAHTWDDGDYIPYVWDRWLADEQGPLIVGEIEGRVDALCKISFLAADQVWLQGMRVDPDYRQRGIGQRFLDYSLAYAQEHGARVARLSTSIRNTPVHIMAARAGMERIGVWVFWQAEATADGPRIQLLSPDDLMAVEAFLRTSKVLEESRGVFQDDWDMQELRPDGLPQLLDRGSVVALAARGGTFSALAILSEDTEGGAIDVGFSDGEPAAVQELANAIRVHAAKLGATRARAWLPEVAWLREAFASAGFAFGTWQGEMCLYERRFPQPSPLPEGESCGVNRAG
jgi:GNAT superfamily N-acetyltransferase